MNELSVWAVVLLVLVSQVSTHPHIEGLKGALMEDTGAFEADFDNIDEHGEGIEPVPYRVTNTDKDYEKRQYPPMTMACSEMTYNITEEDGGEEVDVKMSSMMKMYRIMTTNMLKKKPSRLMFMKLFRYINGLNQGVVEISMTSPVMSLMILLDKKRIYKQMCFYLGKMYNTAEPPRPRDGEVKIIRKDKLEVYVHTFGGYAMTDALWIGESEKMKLKLEEEKVEDLNNVDFSKFLTAGYDSPMKFWNRRNEILFPIKIKTEAGENAFNNNTNLSQNVFNEQNEFLEGKAQSSETFEQYQVNYEDNQKNQTEEEIIVNTIIDFPLDDFKDQNGFVEGEEAQSSETFDQYQSNHGNTENDQKNKIDKEIVETETVIPLDAFNEQSGFVEGDAHSPDAFDQFQLNHENIYDNLKNKTDSEIVDMKTETKEDQSVTIPPNNASVNASR